MAGHHQVAGPGGPITRADDVHTAAAAMRLRGHGDGGETLVLLVAAARMAAAADQAHVRRPIDRGSACPFAHQSHGNRGAVHVRDPSKADGPDVADAQWTG